MSSQTGKEPFKAPVSDLGYARPYVIKCLLTAHLFSLCGAQVICLGVREQRKVGNRWFKGGEGFKKALFKITESENIYFKKTKPVKTNSILHTLILIKPFDAWTT